MAIAGAVLLAHGPYLLGLADPNPLGPRGSLMSAVVLGRTSGQPWIDPNYGFISQALSHRAMLDWVHLHPPWWNPYEGTGAPLAGELQCAALFPLTILTLLSNGQLYEHILLEIAAGYATYLLLRRISVGRWASLAAGIAFSLNGTFAWFAHAPVNPIPFLPLLLLGIEWAYTASREGRRGGWWLIAIAGALSFYAGFPETAYVDALLALVWFAWRCGCLPRERLAAFAGKGAAGLTVGTLLSAPLLAVSVDYLHHAALGIHGTKAYANAHLPGDAFSQLLLPYVYGPIFGFSDSKFRLPVLWSVVGGYLATSLVLLALFGLFSRGRRGLRLALAAWLALALARMYGRPQFLGHVLGVLPGMWRIVFMRYAFPAVEFAVIVLAALGLDELARGAQPRRRLAIGALAVLAVVAIAAVAARPVAGDLGSKFSHRPYYELALVWGALAVVAVFAVAVLREPRLRARLLALVVAVDVFALFVAPEAAAPRSVQVDMAPVRFLQRHLGTGRFFTLGPLQPNYGSYFGIAQLNINDLPIPKLVDAYIHRRLDQAGDPTKFAGISAAGRPFLAPSPQQELLRNLPGYRAAGVAYVLTPVGRGLPQSPSTFRLVFRSPSTWIYQLARPSPYFTASDPRCDLRTRGRTSVWLSCPAPTVLVRRETEMPGWSARVDGDPVKVAKVDGLFQAVSVSSGTHRVTFSYAPPHLAWGIAGFALGCAWLLFEMLARRADVRAHAASALARARVHRGR